ncbi:xylulokinase [Saccharomycopsis crataegensis]|uniref:Xylulose kinase n=1 Tax=Saccharomycopsis crataegensis TaxID=43959 RepID=A0AAV5QSA3_9ASCO|nr:xylulokinase [Saccharomycopsis crataegensis]
MSKISSPDKMFLGLDLSTQQIKIVAVDEQLTPLCCYAVTFDDDLPSYNTTHGVYKQEAGRIVAPVAMWLDALDLVMTRMKDDGFDFSKVVGMSGSCQQHGSVYWANEAVGLLQSLDGDTTSLKNGLFPQAFTHTVAPNWQDHSTVEECKQFTAAVGSGQKLAELTGSKAYHRFTGPQITKFIKDHPEAYENTHRITLISNFLSTVLLGKFSKIDQADGCGMNLYDIQGKCWNPDLLEATVLGKKESITKLIAKLGGDVEPSGFNSIGLISSYFVNKFGFSPNCGIYPFTGDNLATILSLPLLKNDLLVSLGTSTTLLLITDVYRANENYHIMIHPTNPNLYMYMICYSNGALVRNDVRNKVNKKYCIAEDSWDKFSEILDGEKFEASKDGNIGIYFPQGEIIPNVDKPVILKYKFDTTTGELIENLGPDYKNVETDVKGIVESQALSGRIRVHELLKKDCNDNNGDLKPHKLFFVGGSSRNQSIITKFSEILGNEFQGDGGKGNYKSLEPNSCALGGAYKACWSYYREHGGNGCFEDYLENKFDWSNLKEFTVEYKWNTFKIAEAALRNLERLL